MGFQDYLDCPFTSMGFSVNRCVGAVGVSKIGALIVAYTILAGSLL